MSLKSELEELFVEMRATMPARRIAVLDGAADDLAASGILERALKAGDSAPAFELPDQDGNPISLDTILRDGAVVLSFNRGGWCPFCNLELRAYQKALPDILSASGRFVAVLPQSPARSRDMADAARLTFPLLSDRGSALAEAFGVAFQLPEAMRGLHTEFGYPEMAFDETRDWKLPIPATYVIDKDRRIALADVEAHFECRLEPLDAIEALRALKHSRVAA